VHLLGTDHLGTQVLQSQRDKQSTPVLVYRRRGIPHVTREIQTAKRSGAHSTCALGEAHDESQLSGAWIGPDADAIGLHALQAWRLPDQLADDLSLRMLTWFD
jgi:hypothetical protein